MRRGGPAWGELANRSRVRSPVRTWGDSGRSRHTETVIRVLEFRRNARPRRASGYLDVVTPGAASRSAPTAALRPLRISLKTALIVIGVVPIGAPFVHVITHV